MKIACSKLILPFVILLACCETHEKAPNKFSDPVIVKIADLKDRRLADSLYPYFDHENPVYRGEAVAACGSVQMAGNIEKTGKLLLMDPDPEVRKAAAFALGQMQHPSCERLLLAALVKERFTGNVFEILQAYGKTTSHWKLDPGAFMDDTLKATGLAWSLYRAGLRGKTDSVANTVAAGLLAERFSDATRLGAAHFFARGATDFTGAEKSLRVTATTDISPEVRMAAALALGKIPSDSTLSTLKEILSSEKDMGVLVNSLRALKSFPFSSIKNYLYEATRHKNNQVGIAASEIILETITESQWIEVSNLVNNISDWRILANLYEAALKAGRNKAMVAEIQARYKAAREPYERAALLATLKHYPQAFTFVESELLKADTPVVRSTAAATLVAMNYSNDFTPEHKSRFAEAYKKLMTSQDDPAVLGSIATALADSTLGYSSILKDPSFLYTAKNKLQLPEHNEALQTIEAAIARFEGKKILPVNNEFNHAINWDFVKKIPENQRVIIKTTRGNIVMRLFVNDSPGSVANFIDLAHRDYFDNKFFHRVVPNFVIQAGCKRGDGWGSEDYSIRSEFSPRLYRTGSVGMASAGKDTEGTQWFITHSPTPHLDGRYTLFAEVVEGMAVVNYIQVGDKITDVVVQNFKAQ